MEAKAIEAPLSRLLAFYWTQALDYSSSLLADVLPRRIESIWWPVRAAVLVPMVKAAVILCLTMSVMLVVEKLSMAAGSLYAMVFRRTPEKVYKFEPISCDVELGSSAYPMVLVQVPMFNEREDLVQKECERWLRRGMNIHYVSRDNRNGYKAGALKEAMELEYVKECEYAAIFDADHQPPHDFLIRSIPFLIHNPKIALVQARWIFVNADECIMTRIQEMSLNYHFRVEQQSGSSTLAFFGFNGTAGVWRILALNEAEGWKERTTVEDMDLAIRATLQGWKFVYIGDLEVKSELPSTYKAYRNQQHRWACGPANLFKKMAWDIVKAEISFTH